MLIRTKMQLSTGLVLLLIVVMGVTVLAYYQRVPVALAETQRLNDMMQEVFALNLMVAQTSASEAKESDYQQWQEVYLRLGEHLRQMRPEAGLDQQTFLKFEALYDEVGVEIQLLKELESPDAGISSEVIVQKIHRQLEEMIALGHLLTSSAKQRLQDAQATANRLILATLIGMALIVLLASGLFHRTILRPIFALQKGARAVGSGDLTYRVDLGRKDEMGTLARSFNEMAANLQLLSKSRDEFLSTAAHELKTPLAVAKGYVQLMQEWSPEERADEMDEALEILNHQFNRLHKLVQDLLEVSRLQLQRAAIHKKPTDLQSLVQNVVNEMQHISPKHQLAVKKTSPLVVEVDPDRIEQVLFNLLENAVRYSPAGGSVEVEMLDQGEMVEVKVKDYGIGIPAQRQAQLFEKFYRAHQGTPYDFSTSMGVGLYISREFVRLHGGSMAFTSQEGQGSCFRFTLPKGQRALADVPEVQV